MTTHAHSPTATAHDDLPDGRTSSDRLRILLLAGATVLAPVLLAVSTLVEIDTGEGDVAGTELLGYVSEDPGRFYASNLLASLGLVLLGAAGLTVMLLVRRRGGALATAGGVLAMVAGAAAATGLFMYGAVLAVMSDDRFDRATMGELQDVVGESSQVAPPFFIGFMGSMLALLLLAGALWRSRVVPVWVPAAIVVGAVLFFLLTGPLLALGLLPLVVAYGYLARELVRRRA